MNNEIILIINAGSSSIKFSLYDLNQLTVIFRGEIEGILGTPQLSVYDAKQNLVANSQDIRIGYEAAMKTLFKWYEENTVKYTLKAVGHRIVHGGQNYLTPVKITHKVITDLKKLIPLAPFHQPQNLEAIKIIRGLFPTLLQVACFDTAFHSTQLPIAKLFAIPRALTNKGIVRYGFHGLSYEYITSVLPEYLGSKANGKIVIAHLGGGASMCALHNQKSVATSMGFTALDGLMMGTRCGTIDPGLILYLLNEKLYTKKQITHLLYRKSGLLGVSEVSDDVRVLEHSNSPAAAEALQLFCFRAAQELGSLITILKGCDAIVFTAGIGEKSALVRKGICEWLEWIGLKLNHKANEKNSLVISHENSKISVLVVPTNEESIIAQHTRSLYLNP